MSSPIRPSSVFQGSIISIRLDLVRLDTRLDRVFEFKLSFEGEGLRAALKPEKPAR